MTDLERWENGVALGHAIIRYADPHQLSKFRNATTDGASQTLKWLMCADIFARIEDSQFEAFGFQIKPTVLAGPQRIPRHVFEPRPDLDLAERDTVAASGFEYERIRLLPVNEDHLGRVASIAKTGGSIGRPSTFAKAREVLKVLFEIESNRDKSAAKLYADFQAEFEKQFPLDKWGIPVPSLRSLQDHLKTYRQKLAETGRNDVAI